MVSCVVLLEYEYEIDAPPIRGKSCGHSIHELAIETRENRGVPAQWPSLPTQTER